MTMFFCVVILRCAYYGYLCHVLDWWCCFVELNYCAFYVKLFSWILLGMNISSSTANLVIINTHWQYFYRCLVALEVRNSVRTWIHPLLHHHQIQLSWCKWWWKIRGCSLRPSTRWQIRVIVMHKRGQHLTSIVAWRISWIQSPHHQRGWRTPSSWGVAEYGGTKVPLASADRGFEGWVCSSPTRGSGRHMVESVSRSAPW